MPSDDDSPKYPPSQPHGEGEEEFVMPPFFKGALQESDSLSNTYSVTEEKYSGCQFVLR